MAKQTAHIDTFVQDNLPPRQARPDLIFALPELRYPEYLNASVVLLDDIASGEAADRPCIHTTEKVWTYRELDETSSKIARVLVEDMNLVPGARVLLRAPNTPELIASWFGVLRAGGIVVTTMPLLRSAELIKIIDKARITHALTDTRFTAELEIARQEQPVLQHAVTFGVGGELEERVESKPPDFEPVQTLAEDASLIAFTSGTTGDPKGCVHSHRDILAVCDTFGKHVLKAQPDEIFTGTPPLGFTFGLGGLLLFPFRAGASTVPIEQPNPESLIETIDKYGVTTIFTAPSAYRAMLDKAKEANMTSLKKCVAAGEPLPAATSNAWFEEFGIRIIDGLGSTEMLHIFISAAGADILPGATGKPVPGFDAMVADEQMRPLPAGELGRLAVKGPTGCRYLNDPRQYEYVVEGWNVTGDTYVMDDDGYFWFQARSDDMIISSGYNIAGLEVESALMEHPAVFECAVVASQDERRGHIVKAFVVPRGDSSSSDTLILELQNFVKEKLAPYKYPRDIQFVPTLPKTSTGKIQRFKLREQEGQPNM